MTNMDPRETSGPDGAGATQYQGPDTIDTSETEQFMPGNDIEFGADRDGDGDIEIDENRWDTWEEYQEHQREQGELRQLLREEAEAEAAAAEAAAEARAAEDAAREEAHANGEPYHEGSGTHEGEPVEIFTTPNGETVMVDEDGEVVAVAFPSEPVFMGYVTTTDGTMQLFELHDGSQVVVQDGQLVGTIDEVEMATVTADIIPDMFLPPGTLDDVDDFYLMPMGPPSYDTKMVDAATGEEFHELDTGINLGDVVASEEAENYATYQPPGADYTMHIQDGEVVNVVPIEEEPEWSFLGVVEFYEDGTVSIDLAVVEIDVDLIGPEKGISVGVDLFFIEVGAGVEWDTDGNWDFEAYVDVDTGFAEWGGEFSMEMEDGEFTAALEGYMGVQMGSLEAGVEGGIDLTIGPDGVEVGVDAAATASGKFMGTEVDLELEAAIDIGPGGVEGRLGANGALQSDIFGDFEAGASWDSEDGFDSYAGRPQDAAGAGTGLDMGWADDVESGDFEAPDGAPGDGAERFEDAADAASRVDGGIRAGRRFEDDGDGDADDRSIDVDVSAGPDLGDARSVRRESEADGDGDGDAGAEELDDVTGTAKVPAGDGRFVRDDLPARPGRGERAADDASGPAADLAGSVVRPDGRPATEDATLAERPNVRDVFDDLAPSGGDGQADTTDITGAPDAWDRATFQPAAEATITERGAASAQEATAPIDADVGLVELIDDPITAAPSRPAERASARSEPDATDAPVEEKPADAQPPQRAAEPAAQKTPERPAPEPAPDAAAPPAPVPEPEAAPEPEPAPAPEPAPEPVAPMVEIEVEPPPAPQPPPEPPPIDEPELDPLDGTT